MRKRNEPLSIELIKSMFRYDPETGLIYRMAGPGPAGGGPRPNPNKPLGWHDRDGYILIKVAGTKYLAHRLAWALTHSRWPLVIDHANGIRDDNRLVNLRNVSQQQNQHNYGMNSRNTSGFTGVFWDAKKQKWRAQIAVAGKTLNLGSSKDLQEAVNIRAAGKAKYHKLSRDTQEPNH